MDPGGTSTWSVQDGCARYKLPVFPEGHEDLDASIYLAGGIFLCIYIYLYLI